MTRARKRLVLTYARQRRRWGGGPPDPCIPSRFLSEVPPQLIDRLGRKSRHSTLDDDLYAERQEVHGTAKRNLYTGKAANSVDNIKQFFQERGIPHSTPAKPAEAARPAAKPHAASRAASMPASSSPQPAPHHPKAQAAPAKAAAKPKGLRAGSTINHPRYGRGTVLRLEGSGDDLKLTVNFPGHGLKKIIPKFVGLNFEE
jgi:DNA helicase-2/ATP-dependent DNA helicase PcrA